MGSGTAFITQGANTTSNRPSANGSRDASPRQSATEVRPALAYDTPAHPGVEAETVCWWGDMTLAGHFWRLLQLPAIEADVTFGDLMEPGDDRKAVAADLRAAIVAARRPPRADRYEIPPSSSRTLRVRPGRV